MLSNKSSYRPTRNYYNGAKREINPRKLFRDNMRLSVYNQEASYKSFIQEVNGNSIAIGVPLRDGEHLLMPEGSSWDFIITVEDALYHFVSHVKTRKVNDDIPHYLISWPETIRRFQRRKFFRIECSLDLHYWVLVSTEKGPVEELVERLPPPQKATALNLSGGGLLLATPKRLAMDTTLALRLFLRNSREERAIYLKGKIIREEGSTNKSPPRFRYALKYIELEEWLREEIIRFVFFLSRARFR